MKGPGKETAPDPDRYKPQFDSRLTLRRKPFEVFGVGGDDDEQFELSFMESVLKHDPCNEDVLMLLGHAYTRRGEYEKGHNLDRRLVRLRPADPTAYYNLACSCSLLRKIDDAFTALKRATSLGYRDVNHMLKDPDLANLRGDWRFRRFVKGILSGSAQDS